MLSVSRILLPVDFSERGSGAARYAAALACRFHAELTVLHVAWQFGEPIAPDWIAKYHLHCRKQLEDYGAAELSRLKVNRVLLSGDPATRILQCARFEGTDLIVMPTHGYGPFRRFVLGSVTAKVLHDAECPVWTGVHMEDPTQEEWKGIRHVICAVEADSSCARVIRWGSEFAKQFCASVTLIHAVPALRAHDEAFFDPDWRVMLANTARERIEAIQHEVGDRSPIYITEGEPAKAVAAAEADLGADLLVIGRSANTGVLGRLRANAYSIIRESPCPVVSV